MKKMGNGKKRLTKLARVLETCLGIKSNEEVAIICDEKSFEQGLMLERAAKELSREVILVKFKAREMHGAEPPESVAELMKNAAVIIACTSFSITHAKATREACEKGARVASMPGITKEMLRKGALFADYERIAELAEKLADMLTQGKEITIESDGGKFKASIANRHGYADAGILRNSGAAGNLPAGEAFIAPVEEDSEGELVFNASFAGIGKLKKKIHVKVKHGIAEQISSRKLERIFEKDEKARIVCEIGIGLNEKAKISGNVLEDEKVLGTIHVAFGNNLKFGGKNNASMHIDGVIKDASLFIDGRAIVKKGKLNIKEKRK